MDVLKERLKKLELEGHSIDEDWYKIYIDYDTVAKILNEEVSKWNEQTDCKISEPAYYHYDQFSPDIITAQIKSDFWPEQVKQTCVFPDWEQCVNLKEYSYDIIIDKINKEIDEFKSDIYLMKVPTKDFCIQTIVDAFKFDNIQREYLKYLENYADENNLQFWSELRAVEFILEDHIINSINNPLNKK